MSGSVINSFSVHMPFPPVMPPAPLLQFHAPLLLLSPHPSSCTRVSVPTLTSPTAPVRTCGISVLTPDSSTIPLAIGCFFDLSPANPNRERSVVTTVSGGRTSPCPYVCPLSEGSISAHYTTSACAIDEQDFRTSMLAFHNLTPRVAHSKLVLAIPSARSLEVIVDVFVILGDVCTKFHFKVLR